MHEGTPASIGETLRAAREESGLTLPDLGRITRIPVSNLQALEDERFDALPAPVFVRGFIRAYCREVDLDAGEVLTAYDALLREQEAIREEAEEEGGTLGPLLTMQQGRAPDPAHRRLQVGHVLLLLLALVTFLVAYLTAGVRERDVRTPGLDQAAGTPQPTRTLTPPP